MCMCDKMAKIKRRFFLWCRVWIHHIQRIKEAHISHSVMGMCVYIVKKTQCEREQERERDIVMSNGIWKHVEKNAIHNDIRRMIDISIPFSPSIPIPFRFSHYLFPFLLSLSLCLSLILFASLSRSLSICLSPLFAEALETRRNRTFSWMIKFQQYGIGANGLFRYIPRSNFRSMCVWENHLLRILFWCIGNSFIEAINIAVMLSAIGRCKCRWIERSRRFGFYSEAEQVTHKWIYRQHKVQKRQQK